jgi:peptide/nickel transport system substrate-binding protein
MKKLTLFLLVALLVAAFAPSLQAQEPVTLVIGTTDDIAKLDPADAYSFHDWELLRNTHEGLMGFVPGETAIEPRLAVDFPEVSEDGLTYTFTLRDDAAYPDGTAVTGDDVVRSVKRALALQGDPFGLISVIADVTAEGNVVTFTLSEAFDLFPVITALPPTFPVQEGAFAADAIDNDPGSLAGPGAYTLTEYVLGEIAVLEKNPNYYGEAGTFDRITFVYYEEPAQLDAAIEAGDIDVAWRSNTAEAVPTLDALDTLDSLTLGGRIHYMVINHKSITDENVKKGLAAAINRDDIVDRGLKGFGSPLYSMVPPGFLGANEAFLDIYGFGDPETARGFFEAAGFSEANPLVIDAWYPPNRYSIAVADVMEIIKEQLEATGVVKVNLQSAEWSTYIGAATSGEYPFFFLGWFFDYPDSDNYIHPFASCAGSPGLGVNFCTDEMEALISEQRALISDPEARVAALEAAQNLYAESVVTIPLLVTEDYMVYNNTKIAAPVIGSSLILEYRLLTQP